MNASDEPDHVTAPWRFGVAPLPKTDTAARLLREITGLLTSLEADDGEIDRLIADLERVESRLRARVPAATKPRVGAAADDDGRVYLDHSRDIGAFNPCFPEYTIKVDADDASGTVTFPIAFEGPPGIVHGGFLAVFFDCAIQHHNCDVGVAGKTTLLSLRYRRPAPVERECRFEIARSSNDQRISSTGQLFSEGELLCEASVEAVAGDRTTLPVVSPRASAP